MTFTLIDATLTAKVEKVDPSIPVIFGGPHVYIYPMRRCRFGVDCIVVAKARKPLPP